MPPYAVTSSSSMTYHDSTHVVSLASQAKDMSYSNSGSSSSRDLDIPPVALAVIVLAVLCALLGSIYAYLYCYKSNPRSNRPTKAAPAQKADDNGTTFTHLFLFRRQN